MSNEAKPTMQANYHTHTWRCNHAGGSEREYIEAALAAGLRTLGFSDHAPYPFPDGHESNFRMTLEQTAGYFKTLQALRQEYAGRIEILIGFEAEYYPGCFAAFLSHIRRFGCEYLLLGQHFLGAQEDGPYSGQPTDDEAQLAAYVEQVCEGLETGAFSCVAHPDLCNWQGDLPTYRRHTRRLCQTARRLDIPLEINFLGLQEGRHYPRGDFWQVAGEEGCRVIFGCDAHTPRGLNQPGTLQRAQALAASCGLQVEETLTLRRP